VIPDNQITASSHNGDYYPYYGRLNESRGGSWCTRDCCGRSAWLQVDFGKTTKICGVATQGNGDEIYNSHVIDFKLAYSADGSNWTAYTSWNGSEMVRNDL